MFTFLFVLSVLTASFVFWRYYYFYRDPERRPPQGEHLILAPADGRVTYIKRVERGEVPVAVKGRNRIPLRELVGGECPDQDGYLVGIFMSPFSVHINRLPVSGRIKLRWHQHAPRNKLMARMYTNLAVGRTPYESECEYLVTNERLTVGIETKSGAVVTTTQIADSWVDRIIARVTVGDLGARGQRYGKILLGSQVDTFIPSSLVEHIRVRPGEHVRAGETVIAESPRTRGGALTFRIANRAEEGPAILEMIRQNPMVMNITAYTDRGPDYFRLHRTLPESEAWLAVEGGNAIAASLSAFISRGRLNTGIEKIGYATDLVRNQQSSKLRAVAGVMTTSMAWAKRDLGVKFRYFAVNSANDRMMSVALRKWATPLVGLDYVDIVPMKRAATPSGFRFFTPVDDEQLGRALALINEHYTEHQLYEPWSVQDFHAHAQRLPDFGREQVVCVEEGGKLVGAAIVFDPRHVAAVRVLAFDRTTAILSKVVGGIHKATGLLIEPPRIDEPLTTLFVRRIGASGRVAEVLLDHLGNLCLERKMHSLAYMVDPRRPVPTRRSMVYRYKVDLFCVTDDSHMIDRDKPFFFDILYA